MLPGLARSMMCGNTPVRPDRYGTSDTGHHAAGEARCVEPAARRLAQRRARAVGGHGGERPVLGAGRRAREQLLAPDGVLREPARREHHAAGGRDRLPARDDAGDAPVRIAQQLGDRRAHPHLHARVQRGAQQPADQRGAVDQLHPASAGDEVEEVPGDPPGGVQQAARVAPRRREERHQVRPGHHRPCRGTRSRRAGGAAGRARRRPARGRRRARARPSGGRCPRRAGRRRRRRSWRRARTSARCARGRSRPCPAPRRGTRRPGRRRSARRAPRAGRCGTARRPRPRRRRGRGGCPAPTSSRPTTPWRRRRPSARSRTTTESPSCAAVTAVAKPPAPAPTTTTSAVSTTTPLCRSIS